ncbi:DNA-protecting protein DprA [Candidatus Shapirobacteria bacterium]|nr:DNA-protecting protein DprA [Candidatus Shapirobacteria bacterium]
MKKDFPFWIGFNFFEGIGPLRFKLLLEYFGTAQKAWEASSKELKAIGLKPGLVEKFASFRSWFKPEKIDFKKEDWNIQYDRFPWYKEVKDYQKYPRGQILILTWEDKLYPKILKQIPDAPPVLYVKGHLGSGEPALAVIGSRRASYYGRSITQSLVSQIAKKGIVIISGMAKGIDGIAHQAALDSGGETIAVLGSGVNVIYPYQNKNLYQRIISGGGLVISEFPPFYPPLAANFPQRNRIISGLSKAVLVIEAAQKSGTLITARLAAEQGKEVLAVPGPITSQLSAGTSYLISQGAKLVSNAQDILEEL